MELTFVNILEKTGQFCTMVTYSADRLLARHNFLRFQRSFLEERKGNNSQSFFASLYEYRATSRVILTSFFSSSFFAIFFCGKKFDQMRYERFDLQQI